VANANVFTKTNITMNKKNDENAGPISGPFGCFCLLILYLPTARLGQRL
jgi:hypothetical protein